MSTQQKQPRINTNTIASRFGVKPATVRRNLCVKGHFLGLRPLKLPNGRNLWPDIYPEELTEQDLFHDHHRKTPAGRRPGSEQNNK